MKIIHMRENFSPIEREELLEERLLVVRNEYGEIINLEQGENPDERVGEYALRNPRGEVIGKVRTVFQCGEGKRVGLGLERELLPKKSTRYDLGGNVERQYTHEYERPEGGEGAEGDYVKKTTRQDATGDIFQETVTDRIQDGRLCPLGETLEKNGILLTSVKNSWNGEGNLTGIRRVENGPDGKQISDMETVIKWQGNNAEVRSIARDEQGNQDEKSFARMRKNEANGLAFGRIVNRIERAN